MNNKTNTNKETIKNTEEGEGEEEEDVEIYKGIFASPNRIFGPKNLCSDNSECPTGIKGGCRMLTCNCINKDADDDNKEISGDPLEWFDGSCDTCLFKISEACYCIRYPTNGGGWVGCYCGMECLSKNLPREADITSELRLDMMTECLETYGIFDRGKINREEEEE